MDSQFFQDLSVANLVVFSLLADDVFLQKILDGAKEVAVTGSKGIGQEVEFQLKVVLVLDAEDMGGQAFFDGVADIGGGLDILLVEAGGQSFSNHVEEGWVAEQFLPIGQGQLDHPDLVQGDDRGDDGLTCQQLDVPNQIGAAGNVQDIVFAIEEPADNLDLALDH